VIEIPELITIKPAEPITGPDPKETIMILSNIKNGVVGKSILDGVGSKVEILLGI